MSRIRADLLLLLAGLIWGYGFIAQKNALDHIGPLTFVAARFLVSALCVLPLAWREYRPFKQAVSEENAATPVTLLALIFAAAVTLQQVGLNSTSVTNTAWLTGIYVVMVPFAAWALYRQKISLPVLAASFVCFVGIALLTGGSGLGSFGRGDGMVLLCAVAYALQVPMMGHVVKVLRYPFALSFLQYVIAGGVALVLAMVFEDISLATLADAWIPIAYAAVASGAIAYTLQAVAQQHTPAVDAAIIMASESVFGNLFGIWLLNDPVTTKSVTGAVAITASILAVQLLPLLKQRRNPA